MIFQGIAVGFAPSQAIAIHLHKAPATLAAGQDLTMEIATQILAVGGKVISEDRIGDKIEDVSVTAGWVDTNRTWSGLETLRGEVYEIIGISSETAAALKFIDQGEAVTTTHYYVILNPAADLSSVEEYRIAPILPNSGGNEMGEIIPE